MNDAEALSARNDRLRGQVDDLLAQFEAQREGLAAAQEQVAQIQTSVWSSDNLVRVVSNAAGVPTQVEIAPEAFRRATPETLGRSMTEAAQAAARQAMELSRQAYAPVTDIDENTPDLSDIVPGAPNPRELMNSLFPQPTPAEPPPPAPRQEDDDEYYRNRSYLQ